MPTSGAPRQQEHRSWASPTTSATASADTASPTSNKTSGPSAQPRHSHAAWRIRHGSTHAHRYGQGATRWPLSGLAPPRDTEHSFQHAGSTAAAIGVTTHNAGGSVRDYLWGFAWLVGRDYDPTRERLCVCLCIGTLGVNVRFCRCDTRSHLARELAEWRAD